MTPTRSGLAPSRSGARYAILLALVMLVFAGCDTVDTGGELVTLRADVTDELVFRFDGGGVPTGRSFDVQATASLDLGDFLLDQGFRKGEVVSAVVETARLEMIFPIGAGADFLNDAAVVFQAANLQEVEVAGSSDLPNSREAALQVRSGRDVAGFISRPSFDVVLRLNAAELDADKDYELGVSMRIRIDVEGA